MYSLENFDLLAHDYFDSKEKALSLSTAKGQVYIGFESGQIKIYRVTDSLQKIGQIEFNAPIENITSYSHSYLIISERRKVFIYD